MPTKVNSESQSGVENDANRHMLTRSTVAVTVGGQTVNTELMAGPWNKDKEKGKPATTVFFIPGNPGLIGYYTMFMSRLVEKTAGAVRIIGLSHAGHTRGLANKEKRFGLQQQIEHKEAYLKVLLNQSPHAKIILVGHSIGAYIALQLLSRLPPANIAGYCGLYPTIMHMAATPRGQRLQPLLNIRSVLPSVVGWLSYLPTTIKRVMINSVSSMDQEAGDITANELLDYYVIDNVLHMANQELELVDEPDIDLLQKNQKKSIFYFSPEDNWATPANHDRLLKIVPDARVYMCQSNTHHDFCTRQSESFYMADLAAGWLDRLNTAA